MTDKSTIQQVLGCLMVNTTILSEVDKYNLSVLDFPNKFYRFIFTAIRGLRSQGATHVEPIDIVNFLEADVVAKQTFEQQNGIQFLQDIIEFATVDNFPYYYTKLKKLNLLRDLKKQGFDTSGFYEEDLTKENADKINAEFEDLTTQDICNKVKAKLLQLESNYAKSNEIETFDLSKGIDEFIVTARETVNLGLSLQCDMQSHILSGAQLGTLTIRSAASGAGKTRLAVADACKMAFPISYNSSIGKWEVTGHSEKTLFIITEQTYDQIRYMILAYLTDINESKFKYAMFDDDEKKRIEIAAELIKTYNNLIVLKMPEPTVDLLKVMIREQCLVHNIAYVFFDYIFINPSLLREFKGSNLRNDELLLLMATALKDLAVELNVAIFTSTQVNASADDNKNIRNEASLAGGRSTINKADNGIIISRPTSEELETLMPISSKFGTPNLVFDVYKVRSGRWTQVRIWTKADLGTLKFKDLFVTDARLSVIQDFALEERIVVTNWADDEYQSLKGKVDKLNRKDK